MSTSNQNTPTVDTAYSAQHSTTTETVPTIYASVSIFRGLSITDVQVLKITVQRIFVIVHLDGEDEQYSPSYTLNRADLEEGKPCGRKFRLRRPKHRARKNDPLEFTTSHHIIEFSFSEEVAVASSRIGHDFHKAIGKIHYSELILAKIYLQDFIVLGMPIPADHALRLCVKRLASIMDRIPVPEEILTVD